MELVENSCFKGKDVLYFTSLVNKFLLSNVCALVMLSPWTSLWFFSAIQH